MDLWKSFALLFLTVALLAAEVYSSKPNIVFILTDDQDVQLGGEEPIEKTRTLIGDEGIRFSNMFVSSPLCCPSRSSILTGKYVHNNGALNNSVSGNCSSPSWQKNSEIHAFAPYLKKQGYNTFFAGKYLNQYTEVSHVPPGWDSWVGLIGNSVYYNFALSVNGTKEKHGHNYPDDYLTEIIGKRATEFLDIQNSNTPFFAMLSTPACHGPWTNNTAPQYKDKFADKKAPRDPAFNHYGKDKHWLVRQALVPMDDSVIDDLDYKFKDRWRTLLSVDDIVENVVNLLTTKGLLNNTYIFYAADNGYHLGQFGLPNDKRQLYDFDIRVPLMVRGPGIKTKQLRKEMVVNIDLAPTFIELAGGSPPEFMDGTSLKPVLLSNATDVSNWRTDFLVEHTGEYEMYRTTCPNKSHQFLGECEPYANCVCEDAKNNTYNCVRWLDTTHNWMYCRFEDAVNFEEVYNLASDPYQLQNIASTVDPMIKKYLQKRLQQLQYCSGKSCKNNKSVVSSEWEWMIGT